MAQSFASIVKHQEELLKEQNDVEEMVDGIPSCRAQAPFTRHLGDFARFVHRLVPARARG
jgi:hypothetical protein